MNFSGIKTGETRYKVTRNAAILSMCSAIALAALKLFFSILTGSLALLASSLDSLFDVLASCVNFFALRESGKPPDAEHRFGHGKIESLASLFQALIIFASAVFIIIGSIYHIILPSPLQRLEGGLWVMLFSTLASIFITMRLKHVGKKYNSQILKTDALHYLTDIYQNAGILLAIFVVSLTKWTIIDPLIALLIGFYIIYETSKIFKDAYDCLMDHELSENVKKEIIRIITGFREVNAYHNLRTRKSGSVYFIDCHIVLFPTASLAYAHTMTHKLEDALHTAFPHSEVLIHAEPHDDSKEDRRKKQKVYQHHT